VTPTEGGDSPLASMTPAEAMSEAMSEMLPEMMPGAMSEPTPEPAPEPMPEPAPKPVPAPAPMIEPIPLAPLVPPKKKNPKSEWAKWSAYPPGQLWRIEDMQDQRDRSVLITGATTALGFHIAAEFARRGARVMLASHDPERLRRTHERLSVEVTGARFTPVRMNLADFSDIRRAVGVIAKLGPLDLLINNAGVMATPEYRSIDGLDLQMATNHFGHWLLTGMLLPNLSAAEGSRVVNVSSVAHRWARRAPTHDPRQPLDRYPRWHMYAQSKLANLLFTNELERRLRANDIRVRVTSAHAGLSATTSPLAGPRPRSPETQTVQSRPGLLGAALKATAQPAAMGALPILMAATADVPACTLCAPSGFRQFRGLPKVVAASARAHDKAEQVKLWEISEYVAGYRYP